jgi:four helix bundle protein
MRNHRSLLAWQKAHSLTKMVIQLSLVAWKPVFAAIFGQLQKSSLSIQLNIAEGMHLVIPRRFAAICVSPMVQPWNPATCSTL